MSRQSALERTLARADTAIVVACPPFTWHGSACHRPAAADSLTLTPRAESGSSSFSRARPQIEASSM